jgi:riboflavin synthase
VFTGLVEDAGTLVARTMKGPDARMTIRTKLGPLTLGESISVDGVCLTVDAIEGDTFLIDASQETLSRTTLGQVAIGAKVNLERAMPLGGRMGGHIVSGHVDGVGTIAARTKVGESERVEFEFPPELAPFFAQKGSVCVSGVSLTINGVSQTRFDVMLIPRTLLETSLAGLAIGAKVNLEVDLLARYLLRLLETGAAKR